MIFGPLSEFDISILSEKLDRFKVDYKVAVSEEDLALSHEELRTRDLTINPTYVRQESYLYLELSDSLVHYVEEDLERMGAFVPQEGDELANHTEYLCPECDYKSEFTGRCPEHDVVLLEFSDWAAKANNRSSSKMMWFVVLGLLAFGIIRAFFWS